MGCDIHPRLEVRKNGRWVAHRTTMPCTWYGKCDWDKCKYQDVPDFFSERRYLWFAVLAGVRDYWGIRPISQDRGLPEDLAPGNQAFFAEDRVDHTPGWVTLTELANYNYTQPMVTEGEVQEVDYILQKAKGQPHEQYGSVYGRDIVNITEGDYLEMLAQGQRDPEKRYSIVVNRTTTIRAELGRHHIEVIRYMAGLIPKGGTTDDVRMVFYFDS